MPSGIYDSQSRIDQEYEKQARSTLRRWRTQTKLLSEAHHQSRTHYRRIGNCLSIVSLVLGAFTSSTALFTGGTSISETENFNGRWNFALGCLGIASTAFVAVNSLLTPGILEAAHHECEKSYNKLTREITAQLLAESTVRGDMLFSSLWKCIAYFREKLDELEDQSPPIPSHVRKMVLLDGIPERSARTSAGSEGSDPPPESSLNKSPDSARRGSALIDESPSGRLRVSFDISSEGLPIPGTRSTPGGSDGHLSIVLDPKVKPDSP